MDIPEYLGFKSGSPIIFVSHNQLLHVVQWLPIMCRLVCVFLHMQILYAHWSYVQVIYLHAFLVTVLFAHSQT